MIEFDDKTGIMSIKGTPEDIFRDTINFVANNYLLIKEQVSEREAEHFMNILRKNITKEGLEWIISSRDRSGKWVCKKKEEK